MKMIWCFSLFMICNVCAMDEVKQQLQQRKRKPRKQQSEAMREPLIMRPPRAEQAYEQEAEMGTCEACANCCFSLCLVGVAICMDICGCRR